MLPQRLTTSSESRFGRLWVSQSPIVRRQFCKDSASKWSPLTKRKHLVIQINYYRQIKERHIRKEIVSTWNHTGHKNRGGKHGVDLESQQWYQTRKALECHSLGDRMCDEIPKGCGWGTITCVIGCTCNLTSDVSWTRTTFVLTTMVLNWVYMVLSSAWWPG